MIEMMLYLILPDLAFSPLDFLTDGTFLNLFSDIFPHALPLLPPQ
jgi:hypothetical protein